MDATFAAGAAGVVVVASSFDLCAALVGAPLVAGPKRRRAAIASSIALDGLVVVAGVIAATIASLPVDLVGVIGLVAVAAGVRAIARRGRRRTTAVTGWPSALLTTLGHGGAGAACLIVVLRWPTPSTRLVAIAVAVAVGTVLPAVGCSGSMRRGAARVAAVLHAAAPVLLAATGAAVVVLSELGVPR